MANEFIARKGLISLGDSQITGSLETTSNLNVGGQAKIYNRNFIIGTQVTASGFPGNFEFQAGPSTYSSQFIIRPKGNPGGYNNNYWGTIRFNPSNEQGLTLLAGNYTTNILFGRGAPSSANPYAFAKLNNDGLRLQSSYIQSIASAEEKLHVVGNAKITGFVTASGNLITEANITASGHVSASTYYGDGSNLTSLPTQDPFPYTGSAIISGSLDVEGDTYIDGFITASDTIWSQNSGGIAFKLNGGAAVRNTGRFYLDAHDQFTIRPDLDGGGNKFVTIVGDLLLSNDTNGVPQDRLHVDGGTVITGSNSLAGSYALKVTNTSGADILNVENNNEITLGTTPYTPNDSGEVSNSNVYAKGGIYVANTANNFGMSYEGNRIKYNNGLSRPTLTGTGTGFQSSGELRGTTARGDDGLMVGGGIGNEVGVIGGNDLDITFTGQFGAGLTSGQSWMRLNGPGRTSKKGQLELHAGTDPNFAYITLNTNTNERMRITHSGSIGIGLTDPQTNLHISGAVSASTYYGDGSNLTGIAGITFNGSTANGLVTYGSATTADVESKLTFSNSNLFVESTNVASGGIKIFGGTYPVANAYISPVGIFTTMQFGDGSTGHIFDLQNNKLAFDADSTNTYIQADTDTPENLEIHADGNIELRADDELQIFSDTDVTGNITASGDLSISGFPSVSSSLALATTSTFTYARAIMGNDVLQGGASQQDFNSATAQKVKFNTSANTAGAGITIDTTNNRITVLITGYYQITANLSFFSNSARTTPAAIFKVNGTTDLLGEGYGYIRAASGQNDNNNLITCVVELQANDFVEVYVGDTSGVSGALYATQAFFEIGSVGGSTGQTGATGTQGPSGTSYDVVEITGDTTLSSTYTTKYLVCNSATAIDITVPQTASYDQYAEFVFEQRGAGVITIVADTGVTINSTETLKSSGQYSVIGLKRTDSNMYTLTGEREVTP